MSLIQQSKINISDLALIQNQLVSDNFGSKNDIAELHIYDNKKVLLKSIDNFTNFKPSSDFGLLDNTYQSIDVEPKNDLIDNGYTVGTYQLYYNFLRKISEKKLFVQQISSDRTEIIITSNELVNVDIETIYTNIKSNFEDLNYIKNILINFGKNDLSLIINIALKTDVDIYQLIIKLYEPLPLTIGIKTLCSVCEEIIQTNIIELTLTADIIVEPKPILQSANFDLELDEKSSVATVYTNSNDLTKILSTQLQKNSELLNTSIKINVDYENFSNFIHYSNAVQRINNFILKIKQLEKYTTLKLSGKGNIDSANVNINTILFNLDGYEQFLYNSNSDKAYPKSNGVLLLSTNNIVLTWLGQITESDNNTGLLYNAKYYDDRNKDSLINNIPSYLIVDEQHNPFIIFCNMVGQHFDLLWLYSNKYTSLYEANNNMNIGISPDIVEYVLKSFGVKLYNSLSDIDITNQTKKNYNKELYKRIYHNLPLLNKSKGTREGIVQLMNIFGIPDTLYRINEYGNPNLELNGKEHIQNIFDYALTSNRSGYIDVPYKNPYTGSIPQSFLFRLKLKSKPTPTIFSIQGDFNASDFNLKDFNTNKIVKVYTETLFTLLKDGDVRISAIAETIDDNFTDIYLQDDSGNKSTRMRFNLYNGSWYQFNIKRIINTGVQYELTIGSYLNNDVRIGSVKLTVNQIGIVDENGNPIDILTPTNVRIGQNLDFSLQKVIVYDEILNIDTFKSHVLNPTSLQGNLPNSYQNIMYYIPFGIDVKTYNHSVITTLNPLIRIADFVPSVYDYSTILTNFENKINYETNYEKIYYNSPNALTQARTSDKIKIVDKNYYKKILSNYTKIEQVTTNFVDYKFLDIVFSPTFEQDDDIINSLGYFNIDDYIGNPEESTSPQYVKLKDLKNIYVKKLVSQYNLKDYINILQYVDNSLFKMIMDFVPISNNTSTGILIRQNILNRNKFITAIPNTLLIDSLDINLDKTIFEQKLLNVNSDFDINNSKDFVELNVNPYLKTLSKVKKELFNYSIFNQNITYLNDNFTDINTSISLLKYNGVKVKSNTLNQYTDLDISLGKTSNVELYTNKVGLFTDVSVNDIFSNKSTIQLKYLVDKHGNLTDLNKSNRNFYDIQGLFQKEDNILISLFDNLKYSNQKSLDGNKKIYSSGFDYNTVFYFSNKDTYFNFNPNDDSISTAFRYFQSKDIDITNLTYVYDLFNTKDIDIQNKFTVGSVINKTFSKYTIPENGQYDFNSTIYLDIVTTNFDLKFSLKLSSYKNYIADETIIDSVTYAYNPFGRVSDVNGEEVQLDTINAIHKPIEIPVIGNDSMRTFNSYWSNSTNSITIDGTKIPFDSERTWSWDGKLKTDINSKNYRIYVSNDIDKILTGKLYEIVNTNGIVQSLEDIYYDFREQTATIKLPSSSYNVTKPLSNATIIFLEQQGRGVILQDLSLLKNSISNTFIKGDKILFVLELSNINDKKTSTINLLKSSSIYSVKNNYSLKLNFNESLIKSISSKNMIFDIKLISFLDKGVFDLTQSTLFKTYGSINETFNIEVGDIIILKDGKSSTKYYMEISKIENDINNYQLTFLNELPIYVLKENITECLIVNKSKDETKILINFNKKIGDTSYGFIIPSNINPNFLDNIDIITKEVKLKLLNDFTLNKN